MFNKCKATGALVQDSFNFTSHDKFCLHYTIWTIRSKLYIFSNIRFVDQMFW